MIQTKTVRGKDRKVKSAKDVILGDSFQLIVGRGKGGKPKLSLEIYTVTAIHNDCVDASFIDSDGDNRTEYDISFDEMYLHTIITFQTHAIVIEFTCRKTGFQRATVSEYDFEHDVNSCEICGSHGYLNVDVKCECGETHTIELKSW